jgi:lysozyme family protein
MNNLYKYNDFLFESIINDIFLLLESDEPSPTFTWDIKKETEKPVEEKPVTFEWDLTKANNTSTTSKVLEKLKAFLSKLPKEQVIKYFYKLLDKIKLLPEKTRRKLLINYASVFLLFGSVAYLTQSADQYNADKKIVKEFIKVTKKASFDVSQKVVALAEGDYSDDRGDTGNFVEFEMGGKKLKRFIGSKYGISAPVLMKYLGKLPKKEDMINLPYETALDIYKNQYWDDQKIERFCNQSVADVVYDGCVNQGITGMKSILRNVLRDNGIEISDDTNPFEGDYIKQLNTLEQNKLFDSIKKYREERYKEARTFKRHGAGWLDRLEKLVFKE